MANTKHTGPTKLARNQPTINKAAPAAAKPTAPAAAKPTAPAAPAAPNTAPQPVVTILRQPAKPFRQGSARALYWAAVQQYAGQPYPALQAGIAAAVPSTPKRGKLAGQQEPLTGWVAWFKAQGLLLVGQPPKA